MISTPQIQEVFLVCLSPVQSWSRIAGMVLAAFLFSLLHDICGNVFFDDSAKGCLYALCRRGSLHRRGSWERFSSCIDGGILFHVCNHVLQGAQCIACMNFEGVPTIMRRW